MFTRFHTSIVGIAMLSVALGFAGANDAKAFDPKKCTADQVTAKGFDPPLLDRSSLASCLNEHLGFLDKQKKHEFILSHKDELIDSCSCAIAAIEDAIRKDKLETHVDFSSGRGQLYLQRGTYYEHVEDWDRAIADFTESLRFLPQKDDLLRLDVLQGLAHGYHARKDHQRAFDTYVEMVRQYKRWGIAMNKDQRAFMCEVNRELRAALPADLDLTCR